MKLKMNTKFGEESICRFKIDIKNLTNFGPSTWMSHKFNLMGSFWAKYICFELRNDRGVIFHKTEEGYKIWEGINFSFQKFA